MSYDPINGCVVHQLAHPCEDCAADFALEYTDIPRTTLLDEDPVSREHWPAPEWKDFGSRFAMAPMTPEEEAHYAALEREHLGDPDLETGIYAPRPRRTVREWVAAWWANGLP